MHRRRYLTIVGTAGLGSLAGCTDSVMSIGGSDETTLDEPEISRGSPSHPTHGDDVPAFEVKDPLEEQMVSNTGLEGDRSYLVTFIYTSCTEQCGTLVRLLQLVQADAAEAAYDDDVALLAMTFDPETDDASALRAYGDLFDVDLDAGNFHFLRPEDNPTAHTIINDDFGVPAEANHDHAHDDHDHDQANGHGIHYYIMFLVNEAGIVERSYPNVVDSRDETRPQAIIEDVRAVVGADAPS